MKIDIRSPPQNSPPLLKASLWMEQMDKSKIETKVLAVKTSLATCRTGKPDFSKRLLRSLSSYFTNGHFSHLLPFHRLRCVDWARNAVDDVKYRRCKVASLWELFPRQSKMHISIRRCVISTMCQVILLLSLFRKGEFSNNKQVLSSQERMCCSTTG